MHRKLSKALIVMVILGMLAAALPFFTVTQTAHAQQNLLLNPSFELAATSRSGVNGFVPINWELWWSGKQPFSDKYSFSQFVRSLPQSWVHKTEYSTLTTAGWQFVTVEPNKTYRLTASAFIWTCSEGDCRTSQGLYSQPEFGAKVRVGLDPTGGTDPNSPNVVWSAFSARHQTVQDQVTVWQTMTIEAKATGNRMTAFLYFTSTAASNYVEVYWDDASLVATDGSVPPANQTPGAVVPTATPQVVYVPFVVPQKPRADGSLVHTVVSQDTINSIFFAYSELYRELGLTRDDMYAFNNWRFPPQIITIGQEIIILPPGSVDPATGELTAQAGTLAPPATQAPPATAAPTGATPAAGTPVPTVAMPAPAATQEQPASAGTPNAPVAATEAPATSAAAPVTEAVQAIENFLPTGSIRP